MKLAKNKQMLTLTLNFAIWILFTFFIHVIFQDNRTYSKNETKEQVFLYSWDYVINHDGNEDENEK